jgi:hypothetical protein
MSGNHHWIKLRWFALRNSPRVVSFTTGKGCAAETKKWWYLALICEMYFAGGYLPNDERVLWKLADAQTEWFFKRHCGEVLACFKSDPEGKRIYHTRILELLDDVESKSVKRRKKKGVSLISSDVFDVPDWVPEEAWTEFVEMRVEIGKPLTARAMKAAVTKLAALKEAGNPPEAVLNQSVLNSWQGLFGVHGANGNEKTSQFGRAVAELS